MAASDFQHLTPDGRRSLLRMQDVRLGVAEMAARLDRHRSATCRELASTRQQRLAKLARYEGLLAHVVNRLCDG